MDFRKVMKTFLENRAKFSPEEIRRHRGEWVAFSADGRTIVAGDPDLGGLGKCLDAAGVDQRDVVFELIPATDTLDRKSTRLNSSHT